MKTMQQRETEAILAMAEAMKALEIQLAVSQHQLRMATDRVAQLEAQVYGGSTK